MKAFRKTRRREHAMAGKVERLQKAILGILNEARAPLGATRIVELLLASGQDLSARTVRFHLLEMDRRGLTRLVSRRAGRMIAAAGREELMHSDVIAKVGLVSARVEALSYEMTYDLTHDDGTVVANTTLIHPANLEPAMAEMRQVFRLQYGVGNRIIVGRPGDLIGTHLIPDGFVGLGTICSVTITGIMVKRGIPVVSRFGGLLEVRNRKPVRFVELIEYRGSTLDPLEVFIQAGMTRVRDSVRQGTGIVCASFREIPSVAAADTESLARELRQAGMGGVLTVGKPGQPLLGIPVSDGHAGLVVLGGLNPIAAVREAGYAVRIRSLAGLELLRRFRRIEPASRPHQTSAATG
jgi:repressor of nif and glnA expression